MPLAKVLDGEGSPVSLVEYGGINWPAFPGIEDRLKVGVQGFVARPDDIWISGYIKSGTHWSWEIIHLLLNNEAKMIDVPKTMGFFEERDLDHLDNISSPRVLCTHTPYNWFPKSAVENKSKVIYLVRNPKDIVVSAYNHYKGILEYGYEGTWNGFVSLFIDGKTEDGPWFDHVNGWLDASKKNKNILVVTYEEMKQDPVASIEKMAQFIGKPRTAKLYQEIALECNFEKMKKEKTPKEPACWKGENLMYRKGVVGDWKNWFTVAQNEVFDDKYREKMKNVDFKLNYSTI